VRDKNRAGENALLLPSLHTELFLGNDFPSSSLLTELDGPPGFTTLLSSSCSRACSLDGLEMRFP